MDYKQTVEWLKSYKDMYYKVQYIDNKMHGIRAISYSDEAGGGIPKTINDYMDEKQELEAKMKKIEDTIKSIPNFYQRTVLEYKYIDLLTFERIAHLMHYSVSGVFKYHRMGIESICKECKK